MQEEEEGSSSRWQEEWIDKNLNKNSYKNIFF